MKPVEKQRLGECLKRLELYQEYKNEFDLKSAVNILKVTLYPKWKLKKV